MKTTPSHQGRLWLTATTTALILRVSCWRTLWPHFEDFVFDYCKENSTHLTLWLKMQNRKSFTNSSASFFFRLHWMKVMATDWEDEKVNPSSWWCWGVIQRCCDDDLLDKNQLTYNQIYTFASVTQSTTPTINRVNMKNYRMFEYTQKIRAPKHPHLVESAMQLDFQKRPSTKSPLSNKPKNKGGKVLILN